LNENCPPHIDNNFNIYADSNRHLAAWIGGSMVASISTFQSLSIKKSEYDEGADGKDHIINKRTF